jgi:hypothetical protein
MQQASQTANKDALTAAVEGELGRILIFESSILLRPLL